jgi:hypothetical protein
MVQKADQDDESKTIKEPLLPDGTVVQTIDAVELASKQQVCGVAWAGGITGMLIAGPIGAILLGWGGVHLAKKNGGDAGDFCRKVGDFMHRIGGAVTKEWKEARSKNSGDDDVQPKELS